MDHCHKISEGSIKYKLSCGKSIVSDENLCLQTKTVCLQTKTLCLQTKTLCLQTKTVCLQTKTVCLNTETVPIRMAKICCRIKNKEELVLSNNPKKCVHFKLMTMTRDITCWHMHMMVQILSFHSYNCHPSLTKIKTLRNVTSSSVH